MTHQFDPHVENVQQAHAEGRPVRDHGPYGILIGDDQLNFSPLLIADPVPTGKQILDAAQKHPAREYLLYQLLTSGALEELRPEETTDLRQAGVEKFLAFRGDRSFRFELNDQATDWGTQWISGRTLKGLANVNPATYDVFLVLIGEEDQRIADHELFDLAQPGVERFATVDAGIEIFINTRAYKVYRHQQTYWDIVQLEHPEAGPHQPNVSYTVTYSRGPNQNPVGNLVEHLSVYIKKGMEFYVILTDKS